MTLSDSSSDWRGILRERIQSARDEVRGMLDPSVSYASVDLPKPLVVTGLGSSESHARYLVSLANQVEPGSAMFLETTRFLDVQNRKPFANSSLILFSQGLSHNAQICLRQRGHFADTLVFTSATGDSLKASGKQEAAAMMSQLGENRVIPFPVTDEYTILIRVIGPLCGYVAALNWFCAQGSAEKSLVSALSMAQWDSICAAVDSIPERDWEVYAQLFQSGFEMSFSGPELAYAQNLTYKLVEGMFRKQPICRELLAMAHGPLQQNYAEPSGQMILCGPGFGEQKLVQEVLPMYQRLKAPIGLLESPVAAPFSILYFELVFNELLLRQIDHMTHSQIDWPGKGQDAEGYRIDGPL